MPAQPCACARSVSEGQAKVMAAERSTCISSWQTPAAALALPDPHSLCLWHWLLQGIPPAALPAPSLAHAGEITAWAQQVPYKSPTRIFGIYLARVLPARPPVPGTLSPQKGTLRLLGELFSLR